MKKIKIQIRRLNENEKIDFFDFDIVDVRICVCCFWRS